MLPFYSDVLDTIRSAETLLIGRWDGVPAPSRAVITMAAAIGLLYLGTKMEKAGWSTVLMLSSFGFLIYLFTLGYSMVH